MKIKQHAAEQPIRHQGVIKEESQNLQRNENQNYDISKRTEGSKSNLGGKFIVIRPTTSNKKSHRSNLNL